MNRALNGTWQHICTNPRNLPLIGAVVYAIALHLDFNATVYASSSGALLTDQAIAFANSRFATGSLYEVIPANLYGR
jgi:hypothetical protein